MESNTKDIINGHNKKIEEEDIEHAYKFEYRKGIINIRATR